MELSQALLDAYYDMNFIEAGKARLLINESKKDIEKLHQLKLELVKQE